MFAKLPRVIRALSASFGQYPYRDAGGVVDDYDELPGALETQTRPLYPSRYFGDPFVAKIIQAHEYAHQWYGDSVSVDTWRDIWLNEGFATYGELVWLSHEFGDPRFPALALRDAFRHIDADDPFWDLAIGDPGKHHLFDDPLYLRGAMTLGAVQARVGERAFSRILRQWAARRAGGTGFSAQLKAMAERIGGRQLDHLFRVWVEERGKPAHLAASSARQHRPLSPLLARQLLRTVGVLVGQ